ncbi:ExbD/TolR family protein [Algiphilus aromaticivorans]|jgi:biopolymer transport protein ExbD|uniref:ExbD/TolR family protein n=1 Tax=Algiphilus aromaticivorans TaxID=382454 RepID=UPI0005C2253B|nr:biopolymer transporter ExbD [Algiphilus aromaticivorans]
MRELFSQAVEQEEESAIDITPMLDIVFIMLIFFIVTATFVKESGIDVNRPDANTATQQDRASILIAIDDTGAVFIDRRRVELDAVRANIERLHAENPQGTVVIQADENASTKQLVAVMDASREAGVYEVSIATERR